MKNCTIAALSVFMLTVSTAGGSVQAHNLNHCCQRTLLVLEQNHYTQQNNVPVSQVADEIAEMPHYAWASKMMIW